jgi:CRP-like cAMP-binding protein
VKERAAILASINRNSLLARLPHEDQLALSSHFEDVEFARGQVLFEPGDDVEHAFFPLRGCMVALVIHMPDGKLAETAAVGFEGALGGIVSAGHKPAYARAVVQIEGRGLRLELGVLERLKMRSPMMRDLFERFADALLAQVLQSVACNALHSLEARTCRWLLTARLRADTDDLPLTHEFLAAMLGVQRTYVTTIVHKLQSRGHITLQRGLIRIRDADGLHATACVCVDEVEAHYKRVLPVPRETVVAYEP